MVWYSGMVPSYGNDALDHRVRVTSMAMHTQGEPKPQPVLCQDATADNAPKKGKGQTIDVLIAELEASAQPVPIPHPNPITIPCPKPVPIPLPKPSRKPMFKPTSTPEPNPT